MSKEEISTHEESQDREELPLTVTLAKLYEKQGFLDKAAAIYKRLLQAEPERSDLKEALAAIKGKAAGSRRVAVKEARPERQTGRSTEAKTNHRKGKKMLDQGDGNRGTVLVVHGPNLNMLGRREPSVYGHSTLEDINEEIKRIAAECGLTAETFQSNHEGEIVEKIQGALSGYDALIINPAAYTHTSVAIRDALLMLEIPIIEVHLSNVHQRESFRQESIIADVVTGQVVGFGKDGYALAVRAASNLIRSASPKEL